MGGGRTPAFICRLPAAERAVEVVEQAPCRAPGASLVSLLDAAMPAIRLRMPAASARPYLPSLRSMSWMISPIACERGIVAPDAREQHLEGAAVALVRELALEHVEAHLARLRLVAVARHELEARAGIDEAADQPRRRDAIDLHALARHPHATLAVRRRADGSASCCRPCISFLFQRGLEARDQPLGRRARLGAEEIDRHDSRRAACAAGPSGWRHRRSASSAGCRDAGRNLAASSAIRA